MALKTEALDINLGSLLQEAIKQAPGIRGAFLTDIYGVELAKCVSSQEFLKDSNQEQLFITIFQSSVENIQKLGSGKVQSLTSFYADYIIYLVLIEKNLVLTLLTLSDDQNLMEIIKVGDSLKSCLTPVSQTIKKASS